MSLTSIDTQNMRIGPAEQSDDKLLHAYLMSNDQDAFAVLVRRYGPMVWGVCRRILRHTHDAEDAFQATFAVLVRKAPSIRRKRAIGGWLHQVARRAALRASAAGLHRGDVVDPSALVAPETTLEYSSSEQLAILDEEIARLPESLRLPIVLCYLQGLTNREAAECLGCPEGTIVSRLARARGKLRRRLVRRGLVLSGAAAFGSMLTHLGSAATLLPELARAALACGRLGASSGTITGGLISAGAARLAGETLRWLQRRQLLIRLGQGAGAVLAAVACVGLWMLMQRPAGDSPVRNAEPEPRGANTIALPAIPLDGIWQAE
ncbi:MAG TPA: RNA polymerase sigma factor, partial [Planctomycetaceae bacterium]